MARQWWTLAGTCAGLFLLMLDSAVVSMALPSIQADIGAGDGILQWAVNAYLLTVTVLVVTAGRLGDMFGRRRLFLGGMAVFALGSLVSALATDFPTLLVGRVLQGVGAAPVLPLSLAIVCNAFPAERQAKALGIWAGISAVALGIGPLIGGVLVGLDWRLIFWANLPVAALGMAITARYAPESTDPGSGRAIDYPGLLTLSVGLTAVVLAVVQAKAWAAGVTAALALLGVLALAAFWRIEHRQREPIVEFALFRNRAYFGASAAAFAMVGVSWTVIFFQAQYLQDVRGYSALLSGLLILPVTVPMAVLSPFSARLIARFGARHLMTGGMVCAVAGLLVLTRVGPDAPYAVLLAGYLPIGVSLGLVYAPTATAAMASMPAEKVGIASGVLAMVRVMAGTLGLAATSAVFSALLGDGRSFSAAIAGSTWVLVALCVVGTILSWRFVTDSLDNSLSDLSSRN